MSFSPQQPDKDQPERHQHQSPTPLWEWNEGELPSKNWREAHRILVDLVTVFDEQNLFADNRTDGEIGQLVIELIESDGQLAAMVRALKAAPKDVLQVRSWTEEEQAAVFTLLVKSGLPPDATPEMEEAASVAMLSDLAKLLSDLERKVHFVQLQIGNADFSAPSDTQRPGK